MLSYLVGFWTCLLIILIYINKVAVCVFVCLCVCLSRTFSFTIFTITQVKTFTTIGKTTNSIKYFCVTITQVLVQTFTTRGKQQWWYSSSNRTRWHLAPMKFQLFIIWFGKEFMTISNKILDEICKQIFFHDPVLCVPWWQNYIISLYKTM